MRGGVGSRRSTHSRRKSSGKALWWERTASLWGFGVLRICLVVGSSSPGTWCHKETDLKGLEGGVSWKGYKHTVSWKEKEHGFGIQHPLGENHLSPSLKSLSFLPWKLEIIRFPSGIVLFQATTMSMKLFEQSAGLELSHFSLAQLYDPMDSSVHLTSQARILE